MIMVQEFIKYIYNSDGLKWARWSVKPQWWATDKQRRWKCNKINHKESQPQLE